MKAISTLLLLVLASSVMGQTVREMHTVNGLYDTSLLAELLYRGKSGDTIELHVAKPATIDYQYTRRDVPMTIDCYLINGIPYRKSCAPLTKGKWVRVQCYRWRISNGWVNAQNK
jgi:hypothetical protein